ncbi:MAG TPA: inosine/xanthosine triphosphatase [Candidatus Saccharimonadales bacterium]|jgi:inosine/xanthosine triphosphatase|nr:inosine/xanthosine triphosphatase [Candidatus Saccharimonadales bacterium]
MPKIAVGSKNPVKIKSVQQAFEALWPDEKWQTEGIDVDSGVSDQPMSDEESIKGAYNRARKALKALGADYGVGLEGGLQKTGEHWLDCGWVVVVDKDGNEGIGSTIKMVVPAKMMELVHSGKELAEACDILFGQTNSKHKEGHFGLMTKNQITRTTGYKDGVIAALAYFVHPHMN